jgi:hypothetical protein
MTSHFFRNCVYKELDSSDLSESLVVKNINTDSQSIIVTLIIKEVEKDATQADFSSRVLQSFSQQIHSSLRDPSIRGFLQIERSSISQECLQYIECGSKKVVTAYFLSPTEVWLKSKIIHQGSGKAQYAYCVN